MREKRLLIGFGVFLVLTLAIGVIGIARIGSLSKTIQQLGRRHLPRERMILEMKVNNTLYAAGVRNYVFWKVSRYLRAVPLAADIEKINRASSQFMSYLAMYSSLADSPRQKQWAVTLGRRGKELSEMGKKIIASIDSRDQDKAGINQLFMDFEGEFYRIDDFLVEVLSKNNLGDIERQLDITHKEEYVSLLFLEISLFGSIILGGVVTYFVYRSFRNERKNRELLVRRMINLEEEERRNLSFQIHDQLSQDLSALKIYLGLIDKGIPEEYRDPKDNIVKGKDILSGLINKGHSISELLRPPELDDLGLVDSIGALVEKQRQMGERRYIYHRPKAGINAPAEQSLALYRLAQEALTNIVKHSCANNVEVTLEEKGKRLFLQVADDGRGFDYSVYLSRPRRRKEDRLGLGLNGLRQRIELLGGRLWIKTAPGKGTKIGATIQVY